MNGARIYFDNAASTEVDPRVREAMLPYLGAGYGNPDSRSHPFGWEAEEAVAVARESVAALIGADLEELVFTSGATESNNLALFGLLRATAPGHLLTTAIEHSALLEPARQYRREGGRLTEAKPDRDGRVDAAVVREEVCEDTRLVSVQLANNEIGVIQPLAEIGAACAERGILLHTDATQAVGKIPVRVRDLGVHLLSCSAHKIHGPKGVGALFLRRRSPRVTLQPLVFGGGQERGIRAGTLNVPGIVGFGAAARLAAEEMAIESARIRALRERLERGILEAVPGTRVNGAAAERLPGIANLTFPAGSAESLMLALRGVACSAGSACASGRVDPSHVLLALGLDPISARRSLRFSLGRFNTAEEVDRVIQALTEWEARRRREAAAKATSPGGPAGPGGEGDNG